MMRSVSGESDEVVLVSDSNNGGPSLWFKRHCLAVLCGFLLIACIAFLAMYLVAMSDKAGTRTRKAEHHETVAGTNGTVSVPDAICETEGCVFTAVGE